MFVDDLDVEPDAGDDALEVFAVHAHVIRLSVFALAIAGIDDRRIFARHRQSILLRYGENRAAIRVQHAPDLTQRIEMRGNVLEDIAGDEKIDLAVADLAHVRDVETS